MLSLLIFLFRFTIKYSDSEIMRIMYIVVPPRGVVLNDESTGAFQHSHVDAARLMYYGSVFVLFFFIMSFVMSITKFLIVVLVACFPFLLPLYFQLKKIRKKIKEKNRTDIAFLGWNVFFIALPCFWVPP